MKKTEMESKRKRRWMFFLSEIGVTMEGRLGSVFRDDQERRRDRDRDREMSIRRRMGRMKKEHLWWHMKA